MFYVIVITFGLIHMLELKNYGKSTIRLNNIDYYYTDEYTFDLDKKPGFNIAFGISYYDHNRTMPIEPDYGEVVAKIKRWNETELINFSDIKLRLCTKEELGLGGPETLDDSKFYPPHKNSLGFLEFYWQKLYCYDDIIDIHGSYNSADASHLQFSFAKCDSSVRSTCKSEDEIAEYMDKLFLIHVHNSIRFVQNQYEDKRLSYESRFVWHKLKDYRGQEKIYEINNKEITLQDSRLMHLAGLTEEGTMAFDVEYKGDRPYEFKDNVHATVSFEMFLDLATASRDVYTILNLVGEVGGLGWGLGFFLSILV